MSDDTEEDKKRQAIIGVLEYTIEQIRNGAEILDLGTDAELEEVEFPIGSNTTGWLPTGVKTLTLKYKQPPSAYTLKYKQQLSAYIIGLTGRDTLI